MSFFVKKSFLFFKVAIIIKEITWTYLLGWQWVALGLLIIINVVFFQQGIMGWVQEKWPEMFGIEVDDLTNSNKESTTP